MDWKNLNVNDKVIYSWDDFDGNGKVEGVVTEKDNDHLIVETTNGLKLWVDEDTQDAFEAEGNR